MANKLKKSEKRLLITLGIVAVVSGIMLYRIYGPQPASEVVTQESTTTEETAVANTGTPTSRSGGGGSSRGGARSSTSGGSSNISVNDISKHNKPNDCWTTINGEVYDITGFIQEYQSIDETISRFCGTYGFEIGFLEDNPSVIDFVLENSVKK